MGIDFEALRRKLQENQPSEKKDQTQERPKAKFWNPKNGTNIIRILPGKTRGNDFYVETLVHWVENTPVNCRRMEGHDDCPICKQVKALYEAGETSKASKLRASKRYYFNVIDRENEAEGPMVYGCGVKVFNQVLSIMIDPDYGDITDPDNGFDLKLIRTPKGGSNVDYNVTPRRNESPLNIDGWEEKMYDLSLLAEVKSPEEIEKIIQWKTNKKKQGNQGNAQNTFNKPSYEKPSYDPKLFDDDVPFDVDDENDVVSSGEEDDLLNDILNAVQQQQNN